MSIVQHRWLRYTPGNPRPTRRARARRAALEALEDRALLTLLGNALFPADNPWNQSIANAPVAANSAAIMNNIIAHAGDGNIHPDFGQDNHNSNPLYGIPYNVVHGNTQPKVHVVVDAYPGESDLVDAPIPANAVLEGDNQNGPAAGLANRGDSHLIVYDVDSNTAYEFWQASRPSENSDGQWHADQESVWHFNTDSFRPQDWTSADAAGLPILPGLARPDEGLPASQGGQGAINHAIRFTLQSNLVLNQFLYPASHIANPGNTNASTEPPMGARFRLKAGVDISGLNPESKVIAQAMKTYGLILADNGSNFYVSGASSAVDASNNDTLTWDDSDIQDTAHGLKSLKFSDFEVVDTTPVVTGLSATTGSAGSTVTVLGQNFSGAAGHLSVLFGGTPATDVAVVDDGHVTATVPAGSGTVDVRVQSGVNTGADPANIKSPIFGYGISAVSAADQFTYGSTTTQPPQVTSDTPAPGATGVSTGTTVTATFDQSIQASTLSFTLAGPGGAAAPAGVSYDATTHTATLTPGAALAASTTYTTTVSGAQNASGQTMSPMTWSFTTAAATSSTVQVNLTSAFNLRGIYADGATFSSTGGLDGYGYALSANQLGSSVTAGGQTFQIGPPTSKNVVRAAGQTISLPAGNYRTLQFLATAVNGSATNLPFVVHYSDGTSVTARRSISDWAYPQNYAGEVQAVSMSYRDAYDGTQDVRPIYVYLYTITLDPTKRVTSITLPRAGRVKILAMDLVP